MISKSPFWIFKLRPAFTIRKKGDAIDGHLFIDDQKICDTAENAKSAIKTGTYPVVIIKCKQHARKMPVVLIHKDIAPNCAHCAELECVNNNTKMPVKCPMLKPGNGVYKREDGSIIVGEYVAPGCMKHPKEAFDTIYDRIRKNVERGNEVTLIIEEHYPQPASKELSPFEMGTQILAQMGGRKLNL